MTHRMLEETYQAYTGLTHPESTAHTLTLRGLADAGPALHAQDLKLNLW